MYAFIAQHFSLDLKAVKDKNGNADELQVTIEKDTELYVFRENGGHLPANAVKGLRP